MRNFVVIDAHVFSIEGYRYLRLRWRVLKMDSEVKEKQRIIIQFCESVGHTPLQTKTLLDQSFGESAVKRTTVYIGTNVSMMEGHRLRMIKDRDNRASEIKKVTSIKEMLENDRRVTIRE